MNSSILRRTLLALVTTALLVVALDGTATSSAPAASLPQSQIQTSHPPPGSMTDFGTCLSGRAAASCFSSNRIYRLGSTSQPGLPNAPLSLSFTLIGNIVTLNWTAPAGGDPVHSYVIEAGSAPGLANLYNQPTFSTATSVTVAAPNGAYYVRVRAANLTTGSGPVSNEVLIVVNYGACAGPPRNARVVGQSAGTISLGWDPPTTGSPFSYLLRAGTSPGSAAVSFDTNSPTLGFAVPNVPAGSYYARVHSVSNCGISAASNEVFVFVVSVSGDLQISVSWDAPSDVDLHVVEPSGEEIYYGNDLSATGGQLDVDSNAACDPIDGRQVENIRWPGRAPSGTYTVRVDYWASCGVSRTNYLVTIRRGTSVQTFTGSLTGDGDQGGAGSGITIVTFPYVGDARDEVPDASRPAHLFTPSPLKLKQRR